MDFESETLIAHTPTGGGFDEQAYDIHGTLASSAATPTEVHTALRARAPGASEASTTTVVCQSAIAFHARQDPDTSGEVPHPLDTDGTSIGIAFDTTQITSSENRSNPRPGYPCHPLASTAHPPAYATAYEVRRLTVKECCRLMGVPDDYFDGVTFRGKPPADGPMYRVLGNGFAVPVVRWIGERIEMVHTP